MRGGRELMAVEVVDKRMQGEKARRKISKVPSWRISEPEQSPRPRRGLLLRNDQRPQRNGTHVLLTFKSKDGTSAR